MVGPDPISEIMIRLWGVLGLFGLLGWTVRRPMVDVDNISSLKIASLKMCPLITKKTTQASMESSSTLRQSLTFKMLSQNVQQLTS